MQPGARISAAVEILDEIIGRYRPVSLALADWGKAHRFAGSGDRNAIGGLVYDALRRKSSIAWAMQSDNGRALAIGAAASALALPPDAIPDLCDGSRHAPEPLSEAERQGLLRTLDEAPPHIQADVPEWLWAAFVRTFGERAIAEGQAMTKRAPADLRVNTLKATRAKVAKALSDFAPKETALSPVGLRIAPPSGPARTPNLEAEAAFQAGWFEIQDEGSQMAALLTGAKPGLQVLDLCAGAGGKTLALAAAMQNKGQIYAYDQDRFRLKPIYERIKRAGVRNVQVLKPGDEATLTALGPRFDIVLVDAPCTGSGTWRRRPDTKWRLKPASLAERQTEQRAVLERAVHLVKPGGRIAYVTCSILPEENTDQIDAFLSTHPDFKCHPVSDLWTDTLGTAPADSAARHPDTLLLSTAQHETDGFFIAALPAPC